MIASCWPGVDFLVVRDLATVKPVLQHEIERAAREVLAAGKLAAGSRAALAANAQPIELGFEQGDRAELGVALEDHPDSCRLNRIDNQLPFLDVVAKRHIAAHPHALGLRRGDLVANALAGDLALELGEGKQHVERQTPHRGRGVELLGYRDKRGAMGIQHIDDLGEVGERAGQAVDLVDDDDLDLAGLDIGEEPLQRRALHRSAREASVVIHVWECNPSGLPLACDIGLTGFALGIKRIELLLEPIVGRFAGVDRATENLAGLGALSLAHLRPPSSRRSGLRFSTQKNADPTNGPR